jgi:release factor glutamine methyltransferase
MRPEPPGNAGEMLSMARSFLERKEAPEARLEAELLVAHALGLDRLGLFLQLDRPVTGDEVDRARDLLVRRGRREPVAYIIGRKEFYGRDFEVGPGVLIPRPETELLVDLSREFLRESGECRVADLGTGSGCLAITLALELPGSIVFASDISPRAIDRARTNAASLDASVEWLLGDGPEVLLPHAPFDLLVSNPPYVLEEERGDLAPEVRDHEPEEALFVGDPDPDSWVRRLVATAPELIQSGGRVLIELAAGQGERAVGIAGDSGLTARLHEDLARIPRVLELEIGNG